MTEATKQYPYDAAVGQLASIREIEFGPGDRSGIAASTRRYRYRCELGFDQTR
ncbi:MAG: hypothetical protein AAF802_02260 [Planctomycetota bacterium]